MGYFQRILGLLLLKEETYRNIGNDRDSFLRYCLALFFSCYLTTAIIGSFLLLFIGMFREQLLNSTAAVLALLFLALILPFFILLAQLISTLIPYAIGLILGGRPKNYLDFFNTVNYITPILLPLVIIDKVIGSIANIWSYFILYKSYIVIQKLNPKKAAWAIVINLLLTLAFIFFIVMFLLAVFGSNPELWARIGSRYNW